MSRLLDVDALEREGWSLCRTFQKDKDTMVYEVKKPSDFPAIEERWIPCSERLPKENTDILVTYVDGEETRIIPVNYGRGTWYDCIFDAALDTLKITAWMPLPEPYQAERREE